MAKRDNSEIAKSILDVFSHFPKDKLSIQEVALKSEVDWETTKRHLETLTNLNILNKSMDKGKVVYQRIRQVKKDTLFSIPLTKKDKEIIKRLYATIKKNWNEITNKPITKTVVQKIAVDVVEKKFNTIPVAWYLYGQLLLLPFEMNKEYENPFEDKELIKYVVGVCKVYAGLEGTARIRRYQYEEKENSLYLAKENLSYSILCCDLNDVHVKNRIRNYLNEFAFSWERKEKNSEILAILEDFCSTMLNILRNSTQENLIKARSAMNHSFEAVWNLIGTYEFYDSLCSFYDKEFLWSMLSEKINVLKETSLESLEELRDHEPKIDLLEGEKYKKLRSLMGTGKELTLKEKKIKKEEIAKLKREKGKKLTDEILFKKFGI